MIHLSIDLKVLIAAIPLGFLTMRKSNPLYLNIFPFFLMLTLSVELIGELMQGPGHNNLLLFNLYTIIEFCFYLWFFKTVITGTRMQKLIRLLLYSLPIICFINIFFIQGPAVFHTYTYSLSCLIMVGLGITYFYRLFEQTGKVNILREPSFWISIGIIFFFTSSVSVIGVINYISTLPKATSLLLQKIFLMVNAFFYLLLIIAFLCKINFRKSLSS
jgi:hypothetical protein